MKVDLKIATCVYRVVKTTAKVRNVKFKDKQDYRLLARLLVNHIHYTQHISITRVEIIR